MAPSVWTNSSAAIVISLFLMFVRKDWLSALEDHRAYGDHYTTPAAVDDDYDDVSEDFMPLGSLSDSLKVSDFGTSLATCQL